jgi:hypothetical protein
MTVALFYRAMQALGYRYHHFDMAFARGVRLSSYAGWLWIPRLQKGTYRETRNGWRYVGYGSYL